MIESCKVVTGKVDHAKYVFKLSRSDSNIISVRSVTVLVVKYVKLGNIFFLSESEIIGINYLFM